MMAKRRWYADRDEPKLLKAFDYKGEMVSTEMLFKEHNLSDNELELLKSAIA